jgi:hypothetical protein
MSIGKLSKGFLAAGAAIVVPLQLSCAEARASERDAQAPLLHLDFDDAIPGMNPRGWSKVWGEQGDDRMIISNINALGGEGNSLLFERFEGGPRAHWGSGTRIPTWSSPWLELSQAFRWEGPATRASWAFEIMGNRQQRLYEIGVGSVKGSRLVRIATRTSKSKAVPLGKTEAGVWYRVRLLLPNPAGDARHVKAVLERFDEEHAMWLAVGGVQTAPAAVVEQPETTHPWLLRVSVMPSTMAPTYTFQLDEIAAYERESDEWVVEQALEE